MNRKGDMAMSEEEMNARAHRIADELFNQRDLVVVERSSLVASSITRLMSLSLGSRGDGRRSYELVSDA